MHHTKVAHYKKPREHERDLDGTAGAHNQEESDKARPQVSEHNLLTHQVVAEHQEILKYSDQT